MKDWLDRCHFGDVRTTMRAMIADGVRVQTIVTSPPYFGLRSYLPDDHPDKRSKSALRKRQTSTLSRWSRYVAPLAIFSPPTAHSG
ncbi:MAG: hypothetical protein WDN30_14260 [Pararobbsia sp.]